MAKSRPSDVIFLSCPRTLSNLLVKLLSEQQGWEEAGYHLHNAWIYGLEQFSHSADAEAPPEKRKEFVRQLREGFAKLEAARETAHSNVRFQEPPPPQVWSTPLIRPLFFLRL